MGDIAVLPRGSRRTGGSITVRRADSCRVLVSLATDYVLDASRNWKGDARDPDLEELVFNFGRYVILSSSQPGNLPANLRACGITAYSRRGFDYHNNINIQMCYWGMLLQPGGML